MNPSKPEESDYYHIVSQSRDAILVVDAQGEIIFANPASEILFSRSVHDLMQTTFGYCIKQEELKEIQIINAKGYLVYAEMTTAPLLWNNQSCYLVMLRDMTERKKIEESLNQSQKMESVGRMAGAIAHDFNNILTVLLGNAEMLERKITNKNEVEIELQEIEKSGIRAKKITEQLLAFSRKQVLDYQQTDVQNLIEGMELMIKQVLGQGVLFHLKCQKNLLHAKVDAHQLEQVILNMVINAKDAMKNKGQLAISISNDSRFGFYADQKEPLDCLKIEIRDNGTGMSEEVRKQIFEPFFTTKPKGQGTGLGLATSYGTIKQFGGFIDVESRVGEGTSFYIYLPAFGLQKEKTEKEHHEEIGRDRTAVSESEVWVVDNEDGITSFVKKILEHEGYRVRIFHRAEDVLKELDRTELNQRPQMVISDIQMSDMDGIELGKLVQRKYPKIKMSWMSGYFENSEQKTQLIQKDLLKKPFQSKELLFFVRKSVDTH